jgi:uncharacterized protein YbaA (DUF1428 family)
MPKYVDSFVIPVKKKRLADYVKFAKLAGKVWKEHGAIDYFESVEDDVKVGKYTSFPRSVKLKPDELVIFSWITYKSRSHRDKVLKNVMKDPRLLKMVETKDMPFDGKRMFVGGFKVLVKIQSK